MVLKNNLENASEVVAPIEFDSSRACIDMVDFIDGNKQNYRLGTTELSEGQVKELAKKGPFNSEGVVNSKWHKKGVERPSEWYEVKTRAAQFFLQNHSKIVSNIPSLCDPVRARDLAFCIKMMSEMGNNENHFDHDQWERMVAASGRDPQSALFRAPDGLYNILLAVERAAKRAGGFDNLAKAELIQLRLGKETTGSLAFIGGKQPSLVSGGLDDLGGDDLTTVEETESFENENWYVLSERMNAELVKINQEFPGIADGIVAARVVDGGRETVKFLDANRITAGEAYSWVSVLVSHDRYKVGDKEYKFNDDDRDAAPTYAARTAAFVLRKKLISYRDSNRERAEYSDTEFKKDVHAAVFSDRLKWTHPALETVESHVGELSTGGMYKFNIGGFDHYGVLEGKRLKLRRINSVSDTDIRWDQPTYIDIEGKKSKEEIAIHLDGEFEKIVLAD